MTNTNTTEYQIGDDRLAVSLFHGPDGLALELTDRKHGRRWPRVPLMELELYSKAEFRAALERRVRVDAIEKHDGALHVTLGDDGRRVRVGVWLRVDDGEFSATLCMAEVYEDKPETYRLFSVILLPGLMAGGAGSSLLLPLNTGAICDPAGKPRAADRFMIYGEQSRWELMPMLPVCAVQTPAGGLLALARQGAAETECHVATDGSGGGRVGFAFSLRQFWPDPVEFATREIRYVPLAPGADVVQASARRLRQHVIADLGKRTLRERAAESPEVADYLAAYHMKMFFGLEQRGLMVEGRAPESAITFKRYMSFAECRDALGRLRKAGVERVHTVSVGWNPRGHDGLYPTRFPIEERLGGEAGFREMLTFGRQAGFTMNVHDNQKEAYTNSPAFDVEAVMHDQWGQPMGLGEWAGGISHVPALHTVAEAAIERDMRRLRELGVNGMGYLDGMGNPLYRDYHPRHRGTRSDYARGICRLIEAGRRVYGACGTETGFLYCTIPADAIESAGSEWHWKACWPEWPITALLDRRVPLYELALHGLVTRESKNLSWRGVLETVLYGDHPRDEWSTQPGLMPVLDADRIAKIKAVYDLCLVKFGRLQTEEMTACDQVEPGVHTSRFTDNTEVIADFNRETLVVNGQTIARPAALQ